MTEKLPANHTPPAKEGAQARPQDGTDLPTIKELIDDVKQVVNDVKDMFKGK